jgi:PAS domain S-box-containing protein
MTSHPVSGPAPEALFRVAFDGAPVGMALLTADGAVTAVNPVACRLLGRREAEVVGVAFGALVDSDHAVEDARQVARCLAGAQEVFTGQRRLVRPGPELWVEIRMAVLRDAGGAPDHLVVHLVDVTARRAAIRRFAAAEVAAHEQAAEQRRHQAKPVARHCSVSHLPARDLPRAGAWSDPGVVEPCSLDGSRMRAQREQLLAHLPAQIPTAIAEGQLHVGCAPVRRGDGPASRVEATVRWAHPTLGLLDADAFLPAVERSPHAGALVGEVLRQACLQVAEWRATGRADLEVAVTISHRELIDGRIVARVRRALAESGLPADALWVVTTATTTALDGTLARRTIERLRALGVRGPGDEPGRSSHGEVAPAPVLHAASA